MHLFSIYVIIICMKILFITDLYPIKSEQKASVLTLHNFVFEWIKQGHEVDVIRPNFIFNSFLRGKQYYNDGFYEYEGVKIYNVNYFTPFLFDLTKKLPKEFDFKNYEAVIAHMPSGIIFANRLMKYFSKPQFFVCGVHCSDIEVLTNPIYGVYFKSQMIEAYEKADKIACRSFVLQKKFSALLPEFAQKTFVAASGVEQEGKRAGGQEGKQNPHTILTCANLIKRKNIDKLILAVKDSDFELSVIGDGKELKKLKKIAGRNVNFLGRLAHEKVLEEMRKSYIFILPSINETFGMVYLEAMASGCVTVCTKNDGIDGIIKDSQNGFLTQPTIEGIKETLNKIKNFENIERIIENSLATINDYTLDTCAMRYTQNIKKTTFRI